MQLLNLTTYVLTEILYKSDIKLLQIYSVYLFIGFRANIIFLNFTHNNNYY